MAVWMPGELDEWYGDDYEERAEAMADERDAAQVFTPELDAPYSGKTLPCGCAVRQCCCGDEEPDREPTAADEEGWDAREEWMNGA